MPDMATTTMPAGIQVAPPSMLRRLTAWIPLVLLVMLFPLLLVVLSSFKTEAEYSTNGPFALPQSLNFDVLTSTWRSTDYPVKLLNSAVISIGTAVLATVLSLFNAFAIAIGKI